MDRDNGCGAGNGGKRDGVGQGAVPGHRQILRVCGLVRGL